MEETFAFVVSLSVPVAFSIAGLLYAWRTNWKEHHRRRKPEHKPLRHGVRHATTAQ